MNRFASKAAVAAAATSVATGVLAMEVYWTSHRPLPSLEDLDASGIVPGAMGQVPLKVVVLGDSTTTGPGLSSADQIWLRQALTELHLDRPIEVISLAVGGSRVENVYRRLPEALDADADVAIVAVGSNDALHGTPQRRFTERLDQVVTALGSSVPTVAVANIGDLGNIARIPPPLRSILRVRSRIICRAIERVAAAHDQVVLLDVTPSNLHFRDKTIFAEDLFHPNAEGHSYWANAALPGLRKAFEGVA
ncbi:MAG: SGNH/GDSL hydrolase family protein [Microthrixaceae bacterium]